MMEHWPSIRPLCQRMQLMLSRSSERLPDRDYELLVKLAYLAQTRYGVDWLDQGLKRVRDTKPRNPIGFLLATLAYLASETDTGTYPSTPDAKSAARHRLGSELRRVGVPPRPPKPAPSTEQPPDRPNLDESRDVIAEARAALRPARTREGVS